MNVENVETESTSKLTLDEYQSKALETANYPAIGGIKWLYPILGIGEEAGELQGKLAKAIRDNNGEINDAVRLALAKETGDCLWMLAAIAREFGYTLSEIAHINIEKLADRYKRGVIGGSGDLR